jgi:phosphate transport system substrate-binding protein
MSVIASKHVRTAALAGVISAITGSGPTAAQQKITVDGSSGTAPLVEALGKAFTAGGNAVVAVGSGLGTKARFEALSAGTIDVAMASHGLDVSEVTRQGMTVHRIALTPVVFAVHQSVDVENLTDAQLCAIYAGGTRNWKALGGPDLAIVPLARPDSEIDAEVVRAGIDCFKDLKLANDAKVLARAGDLAKNLAETRGAIGMTSATVVEQSRGRVRAIALNGVAANESNVVAARYRLTRDAFLVTGRSPPAPVKAFIDFVRSAEGAAVIRANGAIAATK